MSNFHFTHTTAKLYGICGAGHVYITHFCCLLERDVWPVLDADLCTDLAVSLPPSLRFSPGRYQSTRSSAYLQRITCPEQRDVSDSVTVITTVVTLLFTLIKGFLICWYYLNKPDFCDASLNPRNTSGPPGKLPQAACVLMLLLWSCELILTAPLFKLFFFFSLFVFCLHFPFVSRFVW